MQLQPSLWSDYRETNVASFLHFLLQYRHYRGGLVGFFETGEDMGNVATIHPQKVA